MTRRILAVVCLLVLVSAAAFAGSPDKGMSAEQMKAMKAEMMKCAVCKNMAMAMDEIGPMKMEAVKLNNGMAIVHTVQNPANVAAFHKACEATMKAGEASATMTDEQVKTQLCSFCQEIHGAIKAGAKVSAGQTKNGDLFILTSEDPAVQTQIGALQSKCAMMAGEAPAQAAR